MNLMPIRPTIAPPRKARARFPRKSRAAHGRGGRAKKQVPRARGCGPLGAGHREMRMPLTKKGGGIPANPQRKGLESPFWKTAATYSPASRAVPSARAGLTSLFGMGRGGAPRLWPPLYDKMARHAWKARQEGVRGERARGMPARRLARPGEPPARRRKFRAISSARLCRRRLCTCALSTSSSRTALKKKEIQSCGRLRA